MPCYSCTPDLTPITAGSARRAPSRAQKLFWPVMKARCRIIKELFVQLSSLLPLPLFAASVVGIDRLHRKVAI
jgi:hypothetical protein